MRSFLKRISPAYQLDRQLKEVAHIHFHLDEPDFIINKKLKTLSSNPRHSITSYTHSCRVCGNGEISQSARFCKICGTEFLT